MIKNIPGIYALLMFLPKKKTITIGKLGRFTFEPGWYVYLGSAHAGGGVKTRTDRHRRVEKKLRWNVDHFRQHAALIEIWFSHDVHDRECQWAQALAGLRGASVPVDGFGSHDCNCCPAHLIRFDQRPVAQMLRHALTAKHPEHEPIYVESLIPAKTSENESTMLQKYLRGNLYIEQRRRAVYDGLEAGAPTGSMTTFSNDRVGASIVERTAAMLDMAVGEHKQDAKFAEAVDTIVGNCGAEGLHACFHSYPQKQKSIEQLSRTSRDRQQHRVQGVLAEHCRSLAPQSGDGVYDTVNFGEVLSRLRRARGSIASINQMVVSTLPTPAATELARIISLCKRAASAIAEMTGSSNEASIPTDLQRDNVDLRATGVGGNGVIGKARSALALTIKSLWDYPEMCRRDIRGSSAQMRTCRQLTDEIAKTSTNVMQAIH